jgi:hypothetical protein
MKEMSTLSVNELHNSRAKVVKVVPHDVNVVFAIDVPPCADVHQNSSNEPRRGHHAWRLPRSLRGVHRIDRLRRL